MTDLERLAEQPHTADRPPSADRVTALPSTAPTPCGDGTVGTSASYPCLRFRMRSAARHVCLVIGDERGNALAIYQMEGGIEDRWHLAVTLKPGEYRYRYYVNHGFVTTYARADEVDDEPIRMDRMDAVLIVPPLTAAP